MKLNVLFAVGLASAAMFGTVSAGELADSCVAALEADGRDSSGCGCLEEEVVANDLVAEFTELAEISDPASRYDAASDEAKAAMDKCTR